MSIYKFIKFTGDYSKLKSMGYEFQKLYASNYMQWSKRSGGEWSPTTRIWKKGSDVGLDALTNYEGAFFELYIDYKNRGEELPWFTSNFFGESTYLRVIKKHADFSVSFDYSLYTDQMRQHINDPDNAPYDYECSTVDADILAALDELIELGWVELGTIEVQD